MPFVDQVVHQITTNNLCMKFLWFDEDEAKDGGEGKDEDKQQSQNQRKKQKPVNALDDAGWTRKRSGRSRRTLCGQTQVAALLRKK